MDPRTPSLRTYSNDVSTKDPEIRGGFRVDTTPSWMEVRVNPNDRPEPGNVGHGEMS